ncbi:hypothetical protein EJP82_01255 [Paenibacillus anaericanus]|uniref:Uncharacterized protein n=1 Tax=Paenibacillus anaericanus TaxID=170367 RepID=A0A433YFD7_9BACL|nr:hypothetical protein [Paenibacillus anaericanus]RUT48598.1 hypothetical protein EJP82_01255 [Paenibacillus anaericanus]
MHNGVNHVEYELKGSGGARISLAVSNLIYITKNGNPLVLDDQETLWFSDNNPAGSYEFVIRTKAKLKYKATLDWVPTP